MNDFKYYAPTKVVFGKNSLKELPNLLKEQKVNKVLLHYGMNSVIKSGLLNDIKNMLDDSNISYAALGGVKPNPSVELVRSGIELSRKENIQLILAIGGGSVIDSAKAIAYGINYDGDIWDVYEHTHIPNDAFPIGVILTIPASGSEMSDSSVITNPALGKKRGYNSDMCRPKFAIMNPELTMTLPYDQTMAGATDIMMHTLERYFAPGEYSELTDSIAEGLLRTVMRNALILKDDPNNYNARAEIMWTGSLSHNNLTDLGGPGKDFACHMLSHELTAKYGLTHGKALAVLWPTWARYVINDSVERFKKFAINVMDVDGTNLTDLEIGLKGIEKYENFLRSIDMPLSYEDALIHPTDDDFKEMAHSMCTIAGGKKGIVKVLYEEDMYNIYKLVK